MRPSTILLREKVNIKSCSQVVVKTKALPLPASKAFEGRYVGKDHLEGHHIADPTFAGKAGQVHVDFEKRVVYAGAGSLSVQDVQQATHAMVSAAKTKRVAAVNMSLASLPKHIAFATEPCAGGVLPSGAFGANQDRVSTPQTVASAAVTAGYAYALKGPSKDTEADAVMAAPSLTICTHAKMAASEDFQRRVAEGTAIGNAVNDARTLGNLRPDVGSPDFYTSWIKKHIASMPNVHVRHVIRGRQLKDKGLALMHAVGRSAVREPVLVVTEYRGNKRSDRSTALVGKGVTFDCGGMNVKPYGAMESMHQDMMGAAAVMGTMRAVAKLRLPINVVGVTAFAENAIGPDAYVPSSIIQSLNGKTVEVLNTDAEGRLVLADALTFLQRKARLSTTPSTIVDLATLTGAILVGLGNDRAGLFSNSATLSHDLMAAGARTNELLWPMPIGAEHTKAMKGGIADLVNCAEGRVAGSCTAAAFLLEFVEKGHHWAHLDIAGTGLGKDKASGMKPAGAPGFGVRLLVDYLMRQGAH